MNNLGCEGIFFCEEELATVLNRLKIIRPQMLIV